MAGICSEIFLKDLFLTDLTNPAPKKTRRFAKILSNFLLYAYTKKAFIEETLVEIRLKPQRLDNINRQINECVEMKNKKALENAKKLELKEQVRFTFLDDNFPFFYRSLLLKLYTFSSLLK